MGTEKKNLLEQPQVPAVDSPFCNHQPQDEGSFKINTLIPPSVFGQSQERDPALASVMTKKREDVKQDENSLEKSGRHVSQASELQFNLFGQSNPSVRKLNFNRANRDVFESAMIESEFMGDNRISSQNNVILKNVLKVGVQEGLD